MTTLYTDPLVRLSRRPSAVPKDATHRGTARNRFCADTIEVGLHVHDGIIRSAGWQGEACVVCEAGANLMVDALVGHTLEEVDRVRARFDAALGGVGAGPEAVLVGLADHPSRHSCARLCLDAVDLARSKRTATRGPRTPTDTTSVDDAWAAVQRFRAAGDDVAVATLVDVVGSSPCPLGSHMVVSSTGAFWGAVSGGCVESAVVQASLEMMSDGAGPVLRSFQISNSQAGSVGLPCGGRVDIHIGPAPGDRALRSYAARGRGLGRVLDLDSGRTRLEPVDGTLARREGRRFIEPLAARPRLLLVGGTHIAQQLEQLASTVGYETVVIEPRPGFAGPGRFHGTVVDARPEVVLPELIGPDTAVVMLTHDHQIDDPGLTVALASDAFFVGALGSRKTQKARLERLGAAGVPAASLARLRGPVGLAIGAKGAGEIALSILSEVVAVRRRAEPRGVGTVVLAAGSSRRAGPRNKLLHPIDGQPMVRRVVTAVLEATLGPCIIVLGHEADRVRAALVDLPVQFVVNPDHHAGMGTSISTGIEAIAAHEVGAAFVVLGDMPWMTAEALRTLASHHTRATQHLVVVPVAGTGQQKRRGNPVLWPARYFDALRALRGDTGGKGILARAPGVVLEVAIDDPGVLHDVDVLEATPSEVAEAG